jgi:hypothetical protein
MKSYRWGTEGANTRREDPIASELGAGMLLGQALGFAPAEYMRNQEATQIAKGIDVATGLRRSAITKNLFLAMRVNDQEAIDEAYAEVEDFNNDHPTFAIDGGTIVSSLNTHFDTSANMINGVLISPKMRPVMQQLIDDLRN